MTEAPHAGATLPGPDDSSRLIPSRFPPIPAFDDISTPEDLVAVMELEGWTNDRLAGPRLRRLDPVDWVMGRPNASVVMAAFLHGSPTGMRFSDADLGAWYAADALETAVLEVANGLRRELAVSALTRTQQVYREYKARLAGTYADIFGTHPDLHDPDPASYAAPQAFGRAVRANRDLSGIRYESTRHRDHAAWVCFRPPHVQTVTQAGHFELDVPETGPVVVRRLDT
ncbi:RES family NAD+ phosphorylase [Jannaschia sp. M317]|uniref:RES family NAD+ phosphorylase n=1 Tax=Jannaschia sp. M317 TaxID=2867011 RepID=UPI0021A81E97|nr:RES family NAD+ phosphorylase [Jannaschia sp. M317]UWQ16909.1 RES family NAD+ phosphorylase [Jannaschia sp. M317]